VIEYSKSGFGVFEDIIFDIPALGLNGFEILTPALT
jgi:hypothetical protein